MGNDDIILHRGKLTFYITRSKIYCSTNLQTFYIDNRNIFSTKKNSISILIELIKRGQIDDLGTLAYYCNELETKWTHTDRVLI